MGVVTATELRALSGKPPLSSGAQSAADPANTSEASPAIPDEEALTNNYIPADGLSAALITSQRILVTAGSTEQERVLPFSVIRYLDLTPHPAWTKPQHLRRKRGSADIPVPRVEHTLTYVPYESRLYLFGGMKVEPDLGDICKTLFAFEPRNRRWTRVDTDAGRVKQEPAQVPGPRYAHSAVYVSLKERGSRPNSRAKPAPSLVIFGGYATQADRVPRSEVHVLNVRTLKWALHRAEGRVQAPRRANHAAAVTEGDRYMVIHGGNCADEDEVSVLSDVLYVFDLQSSRWCVPERHPSSAAPPSARRRHCLVNGVGRHEGWLIMYGGHLAGDGFSNDMFMCRIIEGRAGGGVGVVWEKIDVRSVQRPLGQRGKNALKRRTVSGGCLVAIPKLKKYILLGGRSQLGLREAPLLLDPYESDEIAISQSLPYEENGDDGDDDDEIPRVQNAPRTTSDAKQRNDQQDQQDHQDPIEDSEGEAIVFDMEKNALTVGRQRTRRARSALSTPPGEKPSSSRRLQSASVTPSEKSPVPSPPVERVNNENAARNPATNVNQAVAVRLRLRLAEKKQVAQHSPGDNDFMSGGRKRGRNDANGDGLTPPTKRGRFLQVDESDDIRALYFSDNDSDAPIVKGSAEISNHSEFLSASEIARKGKMASREGRKGRGRGRGRAVGSTRTRSADERAEEKRREALEKLNEKHEHRIAYLEAQNADLDKQLAEQKSDNLMLNGQQIMLLEEVRQARMRENNSKKDATAPAVSQARKVNSSHPGSQIEENGERTTSGNNDLESLRTSIAALKAEIAKITGEKDGLISSLKELEEEKRGVQKELCVVKNKVERTAIDRDSYHQEMKDLRKELVAMTKGKETAEKKTQKAEEELTLKKREVELLKADFKVEQQRRQDGRLELSTAGRKVKVVQDQLTEARKQKDEIQSRENELKTKLEKAEQQTGFLQQQLDTSKAGHRKLEDEKIELASRLEVTRIELQQKIKECSAALKDGEKSREVLERERLRHANDDAGGEHVRMRAELERTRKECASLRARCDRLGSVKAFLPNFREIFEGVSAVFEEDKDDLDVAAVMSQTRGDSRKNGTVEVVKDSIGKQHHAGIGAAAAPSAPEVTRVNQGPMGNEGPDKHVADPARVTGQHSPESAIRIPDSDDADEP